MNKNENIILKLALKEKVYIRFFLTYENEWIIINP